MMEKLIFEIIASVSKPVESTFSTFSPNIVFKTYENEQEFLEKLESYVKNLDMNAMEYVIEPAEKEDFYNEGREEEIYVTSSPEVKVLVTGDNLKELLGSIEDQMSNIIIKKQTDLYATFNVGPVIKYKIDGEELKLNISYDIDQSSVKFN